jgi:hypothetical protein
MADNITLDPISAASGAYRAGTVMATVQNADGSHVQRVSVANNGALTTVSVAVLGAGEKVTSDPVGCCDFVEALVSVYSDQVSATDGLKIQVSADGVTWYDQDAYTYQDGGLKLWKAQLPLEYVRVEYTNGATPQTGFLLAIKLQKTNGVDHSMRLGDKLSLEDDANLVKAILGAKRPNLEVRNIDASINGNLFVGIGDVQADAGGRVRVSQFTTLGDYKILNADRPQLWENVGTGTGLFTGNKYSMSVAAGEWLVRQTLRPHHYFSGKSQAIEITFDNFHPQENIVKRAGYFSSSTTSPYSATLDGIWLENDGTTIRFISSRAGTETMNIALSDWSGYQFLNSYQDPAHWENFTVCLIDFLWLGGAILRLWVKTQWGFVLAHQFDYSGTAKDVFILTPNQPLRYEIRSTTGAGELRYICAQVATEGSTAEGGITGSVDTGTTAITLASIGTKYPLKALRKKATARDIVSKIDTVNALVASADTVLWTLEISPTLSAPLTYADVPNSSMQAASGNGTITVTAAGNIIASGFLTQNTPIPQDLLRENFLAYMGGSITGTQQEYVLCITPVTNNVSAYGTLGFKEY